MAGGYAPFCALNNRQSPTIVTLQADQALHSLEE